MAGAANVMKMLKDNEVRFVDLRFTDTRGKEQHVSAKKPWASSTKMPPTFTST